MATPKRDPIFGERDESPAPGRRGRTFLVMRPAFAKTATLILVGLSTGMNGIGGLQSPPPPPRPPLRRDARPPAPMPPRLIVPAPEGIDEAMIHRARPDIDPGMIHRPRPDIDPGVIVPAFRAPDGTTPRR